MSLRAFRDSYLDLMDKGTLQGLAKYQDAHAVVSKLYEGLLSGPEFNRPNPPAPEKPGFMIFTQRYLVAGQQPGVNGAQST
ncbi:MAG: multiheme c-type cytochrome [Nitrosomonas sp.]